MTFPESTEATTGARLLPTDQLLTNENSAALTAGALGLGIGVAGSLLVGKIIDDASRCRPPAITKFLPLPDLLNFNGLVNPDCNKKYGGYSEVWETLGQTVYPVQYPSAGYDTIPLSRSDQHIPSSPDTCVFNFQIFSQHYITDFSNLPVTQSQLTPDVAAYYHYQQGLFNTNHQSSGGFSETNSYIPSADNVHSVNSPDLSHTATQNLIFHNNNHQHGHQSIHNVHNAHELFPMEVNPAIQPRGLPEHEVLFSPSSSSKKLTSFSETGAVVSSPDISFPDTNGPRAKRRDSSRSVAGFSETGAVVAEPDAFRFSVENQESRQGRVFAVQSSSFSETAPLVPEPDQEKSVTRESQEDRRGRVVFRPVAAKTSSFSDTIPVVPGANVQVQRLTGGNQEHRHGRVSSSKLFRPVAAKSSTFSEIVPVVPGANVQLFNGRQDIRQGKVLQPDTSMFSSTSEMFTETNTVIAQPEAKRNRESPFRASEEIQESRGGRVLGPDMTLFQPQSSSFSQTVAVVPEPDEVRNEKSAKTREEAERPVLFQPRPKAKRQRQGRLLHQEESQVSIIQNEPKKFSVSPLPATVTEPKKFSFGLN